MTKEMNMIERIKHLQEQECIADILVKEVSAHECNGCGKCLFGYEGITQLGMILHDITEKKGNGNDIGLIREAAGLMQTQSICEAGRDIAATVLAALELHGEALEEHITKRVCRAGVCRKYMTFHILPDQCTGCNECVDVCDEDAILGKRRFIHVIEQDECIQCGACLDACEEGAIVRAGAVKPRCPKKPIPCKR